MHRLALVAVITAACRLRTTAGGPATPPVGNHRDVEAVPGLDARGLDALAFLQGCWSKWEVDWGFRLCWKRAGAAWLGSLDSQGPMGPTWHVDFRITRGAHALAWTASTTSPATWFAATPVVELTASGPDLAVFGSREHPVDRVVARDPARDALLFQPSEKMGLYRLERRTGLAP
jgi:hypothetical protein